MRASGNKVSASLATLWRISAFKYPLPQWFLLGEASIRLLLAKIGADVAPKTSKKITTVHKKQVNLRE